MAKCKQGFLLFHEDISALRKILSQSELGELLCIIADYSETGVLPDHISDRVIGAVALMLPKIDKQTESYSKTSQDRTRAARAKWDGNAEASNASECTCTEMMHVHENDARACNECKQEQEQEQEQELKQEQEHCDIGGEAANAHAHTRETLTAENDNAENDNAEDDAPEESKRSKKVKQIRHKYGEYSNVLLTDDEYAKLVAEYPDQYSALIERLSSYMASTGKRYKSHLATMRNWVRMDYERGTARSAPAQRAAPVQHRESTADYYMRMAQSMPDDDGGVSSDGKTGNGDFDPFDF